MDQISFYDDNEELSPIESPSKLNASFGDEKSVAEDGDVCQVCLDGEVYDDNEIIFCDKCNVPVHQSCYNVPVIPEGSWFCQPCALNLSPSTLQCELCSNTGGAYKMTDKGGKWAHPLCAAWIPEIYESFSTTDKVSILRLTNLDKKRSKLRCALCPAKGSCVQCCYGRCTTGAHPWCILKNPKGWTKRIIKNDEGNMIWEVFCKQHCKAVTEPIKPKPKAKQSVPISMGDDEDDYEYANNDGITANNNNSGNNKKSSSKYEPDYFKEEAADDKYIPVPSKSRPKSLTTYNKNNNNSDEPRLSMNHAKYFDSSITSSISKDKKKKSSSNIGKQNDSLDKNLFGSNDNDNNEDNDDDNDNEDDHSPRNNNKNLPSMAGKGSKTKKNIKSDSKHTQQQSVAFPILNMLEWPGQSEGEAMDLEHFWNVMSSYYPEDHTAQWLEYMIRGNYQACDATEFEDYTENPTYQSLLQIPSLTINNNNSNNSNKDILDQIEEKLTLLGGERERNVLYDWEKRQAFLNQINHRILQLQGKISTVKPNNSGNNNNTSNNDNNNALNVTIKTEDNTTEITSIASDPTVSIQHQKNDNNSSSSSSSLPNYVNLVENDFYTKQYGKLTSEDDVIITEDPKNKEGHSMMHVVFDGEHRVACDFAVQFPAIDSNSNNDDSNGKNSYKNAKGWHTVSMKPEKPRSYEHWVKENLIPCSEEDRILPGEGGNVKNVASTNTMERTLSALTIRTNDESGENEMIVDNNTQENSSNNNNNNSLKAKIKMTQLNPVKNDAEIVLNDRIIISRDDDNVICRVIRTDQQVYTALVDSLKKRIALLTEEAKVRDISSKHVDQYKDWDVINQKYRKLQIWKRIGNSLVRGLRDQSKDFNKPNESEALPASWTISVAGRPSAKEVEEEEEEAHEDAVCMCCFDGTSVEGNRILFCDGCNATLHQYCYGVNEIPEGDFYCDRCKYIQNLVSEHVMDASELIGHRLKTAVMCCLCPQYHGGFKPTTDGRWVHLSCALWSKSATITDLTEMGPVDVSEVIVQPIDDDGSDRKNRKSKKQFESSNGNNNSNNSNDNVINECCMYCKVYGGYVVRCEHTTDDNNEICSSVFHPICAWFDGVYVTSEITDTTYSGTDRDGRYPSGYELHFRCNKHCSDVRAYAQIQDEQALLRNKYRIKEEDLEQIPDKNKKRRKKPKKKQSATNNNATLKDLNPDHYDDKTCAMCMTPLTHDVFGCGYDPTLLTCSMSDLQYAKQCALQACTALQALEAETANTSTGSTGNDNNNNNNNNISKETKTNVSTALTQDGEVLQTQTAAVTTSTALFNSILAVGKDMLRNQDNVANSSSLISADIIASVAVEDIKSESVAATGINPDVQAIPYESRSKNKMLINPNKVARCIQCKLTVHKSCIIVTAPVQPSFYDNWLCGSCSYKQLTGGNQVTTDTVNNTNTSADSSNNNDLRCILCPRRGGYFHRTSESDSWVHLYCAKWAPGQVRVLPDGILDIHQISKESKKQKCLICNRKNGASVRCSALGCNNYFHPLCGIRSGRTCIRARLGVKQFYCPEHIPEGVEKVSSGHWIDGFEMVRFRYCLDRARLIMDLLAKRDKFKKQRCKTEGEMFTARFNALLDRAKGRKSTTTVQEEDDDISIGSINDYDSDEILSDNERDIFGGDSALADSKNNNTEKKRKSTRGTKEEKVQDEYILLPKYLETVTDKSPDLTLPETDEHDEMVISGTWVRNNEIKLPKKILAFFCGVEINNKDNGGVKTFLKTTQDVINKSLNISRMATQIFVSQHEETKFAKALGPELIKHVQDDEAFLADMKKIEFTAFNAEQFEIGAKYKKKAKAAAAKIEKNVSTKDKKTNSKQNKQQQQDQPQDQDDSSAVALPPKKKLKKGYVIINEYDEEDDDNDDDILLPVTNNNNSKSNKSKEVANLATSGGRGRKRNEVEVVETKQQTSKKKKGYVIEDEDEEDDVEIQAPNKKKPRGNNTITTATVKSSTLSNKDKKGSSNSSASNKKITDFYDPKTLISSVLLQHTPTSGGGNSSRKTRGSFTSPMDEDDDDGLMLEFSPHSSKVTRRSQGNQLISPTATTVSHSVYHSIGDLKDMLNSEPLFSQFLATHPIKQEKIRKRGRQKKNPDPVTEENAVLGNTIGFDSVMNRVTTLLQDEGIVTDDWVVCKEDDDNDGDNNSDNSSKVPYLYQLERRIQDILNDIEYFQVPENIEEDDEWYGNHPMFHDLFTNSNNSNNSSNNSNNMKMTNDESLTGAAEYTSVTSENNDNFSNTPTNNNNSSGRTSRTRKSPKFSSDDSNISSSSNNRIKARKRSSPSSTQLNMDNSNNMAMRGLADEFIDVPYDDIYDYDDNVRVIVTLSTMRERLRNHEYKSMAEVSKDFYVLLNNARNVTQPDSRVWKDTVVLSRLYEELKNKSITVSSASNAKTKPLMAIKVSDLIGRESPILLPDTEPVTATCCCCHTTYELSNWPEEFDINNMPYFSPTNTERDDDDDEDDDNHTASNSNKRGSGERNWAMRQIMKSKSTEFQFPVGYTPNNNNKNKKKDGNSSSVAWMEQKEQRYHDEWNEAVTEYQQLYHWMWLCSECVQVQREALIGSDVLVWWHDDSSYYRGRINAYDEISKCHRIYYEDEEWEFLNLALEPFLIYPAPTHSINAVTYSINSSSSNSNSNNEQHQKQHQQNHANNIKDDKEDEEKLLQQQENEEQIEDNDEVELLVDKSDYNNNESNEQVVEESSDDNTNTENNEVNEFSNGNNIIDDSNNNQDVDEREE